MDLDGIDTPSDNSNEFEWEGEKWAPQHFNSHFRMSSCGRRCNIYCVLKMQRKSWLLPFSSVVVLEAESLDCSQNVLNCFVFPHCCFPLFLGRNVSTVCLETGCRPATGFSLPRGKVTRTPYLLSFFSPAKLKSINQRYGLSPVFTDKSPKIHFHFSLSSSLS